MFSFRQIAIVSALSLAAFAARGFAADPAETKADGKPKLTAVLVDPEKKAKEQTATVKVTTEGVKIVDPATVNEKAAAGEGHFHYTVDDGPAIATTAPKLSFHDLKTGKHTIKVVLAGNDHKPLGPQETLTVTIP